MLKDRLIKLRKERKKTQQEMANLLKITRPAYTAYERGNRNPDYETLLAISDYFGVSTDYLLGKSDKPRYEDNNNYDPLEDLKQFLIENNMQDIDFGFFDIEQWKKLGPDEIDEIKRHFEWVAAKAEQMEREKEKKKK